MTNNTDNTEYTPEPGEYRPRRWLNLVNEVVDKLTFRATRERMRKSREAALQARWMDKVRQAEFDEKAAEPSARGAAARICGGKRRK